MRRAIGQRVPLSGYRVGPEVPRFRAVYQEGREDSGAAEDGALPELTAGDGLTNQELKGIQHFTQPPPRFSEATLIKEMEDKGIGRPSTYAPTIATLVEREYVEREQRRCGLPSWVAR